MPVEVMLHLIACIAVAAGILLMIPKFFDCDDSYFICKAISLTSWLGYVVGIALAIIAVFAKTPHLTLLLNTIAFSLFIAATLVVAPKLFCGGACQYNAALAWLSIEAGLILGLIGLHASINAAYVLHSITYPLIILGLALTACRYMKNNCVFGILSWVCLVAGLVLEIISVHV